jgi:hypothetical protein
MIRNVGCPRFAPTLFGDNLGGDYLDFFRPS